LAGDAVGGRGTDRVAARVQVPGLVLHDRGDRAVPFSHGASVAAGWPGSRFVPLDGFGHRRVLDAPVVHEEILAFIKHAIAESSARSTMPPEPRSTAWETRP